MMKKHYERDIIVNLKEEK